VSTNGFGSWRNVVRWLVIALRFRVFPRSRPRPRPSLAGSLLPEEVDVLLGIARAAAARWSLGEVDRGSIVEFLRVKTESEPSYLAEYRSVCRFAAARGVSEDKLLKRLLAPWPTTFYRAARELVVRELILVQLSVSGAGYYGPGNFPGFPGGKDGYRQADLWRVAAALDEHDTRSGVE
jgi:hypothetical protein